VCSSDLAFLGFREHPRLLKNSLASDSVPCSEAENPVL
jgi:hypothetical protein